MCDCERERSSHKLSKRTVSLWSVLDVYLVLFVRISFFCGGINILGSASSQC